MVYGRDGDENYREHGENERLYEANEDFKKKKGERDDVGREKSDDGEENFTGEDVAEESERE